MKYSNKVTPKEEKNQKLFLDEVNTKNLVVGYGGRRREVEKSLVPEMAAMTVLRKENSLRSILR